jgi:hypothetical protein
VSLHRGKSPRRALPAEQPAPAEQRRLLRALISRIDLGRSALAIHLRPAQLPLLSGETSATVDSALHDRHPIILSTQRLATLVDLPIAWNEQRQCPRRCGKGSVSPIHNETPRMR